MSPRGSASGAGAEFASCNRHGCGESKFDPSAALGDEATVWGAASARFKDVDGNSFALASFDAMTPSRRGTTPAEAAKLEAERRGDAELEIAKAGAGAVVPTVAAGTGTLEYAGTCIQARQVGGDYYDFLTSAESGSAWWWATSPGKALPPRC